MLGIIDSKIALAVTYFIIRLQSQVLEVRGGGRGRERGQVRGSAAGRARRDRKANTMEAGEEAEVPEDLVCDVIYTIILLYSYLYCTI